MQLNVLDVCWRTSCVLMHKKIDMDDQGDPWCIWMSIDVQVVEMHQGIHMDAQDDPQWSWMSPMSRVAQFVTRCTKGFIWILKMSIDAAGCLSLHKLYLDAATHFYGWLRWPSMKLDVLDVYLWTSCALMHQHIFMDAEDDTEFSWMSWMSINALDDPRCSLMSGSTSCD